MLPLAGAAVLLHPSWRSRAIEHGLALSDAVSEWMFDQARRAQTFSDGEVTPFDRFPLNSYLVDDPEIDLDDWRLEVSGLVARPGQYGLDALRALPRVTQNTRHICIEGWDVIGSFGGAPLSELLALSVRIRGRAFSRWPARTTTTSRWTWPPHVIRSR